jgi:hypothetical protein
MQLYRLHNFTFEYYTLKHYKRVTYVTMNHLYTQQIHLLSKSSVHLSIFLMLLYVLSFILKTCETQRESVENSDTGIECTFLAFGLCSWCLLHYIIYYITRRDRLKSQI